MSQSITQRLCSVVQAVNTETMIRSIAIDARINLNTSTRDWNRVMCEAESVVRSSVPESGSSNVFSDKILDFALSLRNLAQSNNLVFDTVKRLAQTHHRNNQTRGLIVLLVAKSASHSPQSKDYTENSQISTGISQRQKSLAEMTEMIHLSHSIHCGIQDVHPLQQTNESHLFNQVSVLCGDYLLAEVWKGLAELRDTRVGELMASAIADFAESQFISETTNHNNNINGIKLWEKRNFLRWGSLQAISCKGAVMLAAQCERSQSNAYEFGKNVALGFRAVKELRPFIGPLNTTKQRIDLMSAPVVFHIENSGKETLNIDSSALNDSSGIRSLIRKSSAIGMTSQLITGYRDKAREALNYFPKSESTNALSNILLAMKE